MPPPPPPQEIPFQTDNKTLNDCNNILLRSQNNMNISPADSSNFRNSDHHDVNVNRVQSPLKINTKFTTTP